MAYEFKNFILLEEGAVAIFASNRPEVLNALNPDSLNDLFKFADYLEQAEHIRAGILTGVGEKAFIAGADIGNVQHQTGTQTFGAKLSRICMLLENCSKPVIAAVNGYAFGGGFELALACDVRIASENAVFGLPETNLGLIPGGGGTQRLARMTTPGIAKDMILAGRTLSPQEAVQFGLVMKTYPAEGFMDAAKKLANKIAMRGPLALQLGKRVINASVYTDLSTGCMMENLAFAFLVDSKDKKEGTAAFLEKRKPQFTGE